MRTTRGRAAAIAIATTIGMVTASLSATTTLAMPVSAAEPRCATTARHRAQVVGAVVDREGSAIGGVTVVARPVGLPAGLGLSSGLFETVTDARGAFHFDGLPPGTYWFVAYELATAGSSPAIPVIDSLELRLRLDDVIVRS